MARTVEQTQQLVGLGFDETIVAALEADVDTVLDNKVWMDENAEGEAPNRTWTITLQGVLTDGEKNEIARRFTAANWKNVQVRNVKDEGDPYSTHWLITLSE